MASNDYAETVAAALIAQLERGTAPWQRPWKPGERFMPYNPTTRADYRGMNAVWLMSIAETKGYGDARWMTFKQSQAEGAQVRKGEKGALIQYWKLRDTKVLRDDAGKPILDEQGQPKHITIELERPRVFSAVVFNAAQIDGLAPAENRPALEPWQRHERAEAILSASGVPIGHEAGNRAFYKLSNDSITLPERSQFETADSYYATALHELAHATGHPSRLNRDLAHPFGSEGYAKEELRAEIASLMMGEQLSIGHDPGQHAAYVKSWIKVLQDDPREIFRAAADAEKITKFVRGLEQSREANPLSLPIAAALDDPGVSFGHFQSFRGESLEAALSAAGMKTVGDVVSRNGVGEARSYGAMFATAIERLSPVFGIEAADQEPTNAYLERKGLAGHLAGRGEELLKAQAEQQRVSQAGEDGPQIVVQTPAPPSEVAVKVSGERVYLAVPYAEKDDAKALGARWDKSEKSWYAPPGTDLAPLDRWAPGRDEPVVAIPDPNSKEEFATALREAGLEIGGEPIMDGQLRRVAVNGDRKGERSGAYVGFSDGHPAGYINNYRTGFEQRWKSAQRTTALSAQDRARQAAEAAERRQERAKEREKEFEGAMATVEALLAAGVPATEAHPYLIRKGVPSYGLKLDAAGNLIVPVRDMDGALMGAQSIDPEGRKSFVRGGRVMGGHFLVGELGTSGPILFSEGYATAAELHRATDLPVVVTFNAGNLGAVTAAFRERHPDRSFVITGDNDHRKELETGPDGLPKPNVGKIKAEAAAVAVGGSTMLPPFASGERGSDWNDFRQLRGQKVFVRELRTGLAVAQRRALASAVRTQQLAPEQRRQQARAQRRDSDFEGVSRGGRRLHGR